MQYNATMKEDNMDIDVDAGGLSTATTENAPLHEHEHDRTGSSNSSTISDDDTLEDGEDSDDSVKPLPSSQPRFVPLASTVDYRTADGRIPLRERGDDGQHGGLGRISESASTVRPFPAHVLEELERIRDGRESEMETPTTSIRMPQRRHQQTRSQDSGVHSEFDIHVHASSKPSTTSSSFLVLPTTASMIAHTASFSQFNYPPSPHLRGADSSALPSPPSSPADSVSSLPSVTSSFFFSSAAASPRMYSSGHLEPPPGVKEEVEGHATNPPTYKRRRTIRPQSSYYDESSSLESSPSSLELFSGSRGNAPSRQRGVWTKRARSRSRHGGVGRASGTDCATNGLVIPSLTLPPALKRPTIYGRTLGDVRVLVLSRCAPGQGQGAGRGFVASLLLEDNEDVVDVGEWEDPADFVGGEDEGGDEEMRVLGEAGAKILRASTDWIEHCDAHGLERWDAARNVEVVELPGYESDAKAVVEKVKAIVEGGFKTVERVLNPHVGVSEDEEGVMMGLVSGGATPLWTALVLLLPTPIQDVDKEIIEGMGAYVPVIVMPSSSAQSTLDNSNRRQQHANVYFSNNAEYNASTASSPMYPVSSSSSFSSNFPTSLAAPGHADSAGLVVRQNSRSNAALPLSAFRPSDVAALKFGLFHSPETIGLLRDEAAGRFLRWREVKRAVRSLQVTSFGPLALNGNRRDGMKVHGEKRGVKGWDKEKWEREWMGEFSRDVALALREKAVRDESRDQIEEPEDGSKEEGESEVDVEKRALILDDQQRDAFSDSKESESDDSDDDVDPSLRLVPYSYPHGYYNLYSSRPLSPSVTSSMQIHAFDPLHLPSLVIFTVSMLGPLKERIVQMVKQVCLGLVPVALGRRRRRKGSRRRARVEGGEGRDDWSGNLVDEKVEMRAKERDERRQRKEKEDAERRQWAVVGGMVGVGFCVGVGVGVVAAKSAD